MADYFSYIPKNGDLNTFKQVNKEQFLKKEFGEIFEKNYPLSSSINVEFLTESSTYTRDRRHIYALQNTLNYYKAISPHYSYSSSFGDKAFQNINLISIPSIFYGSAIDKGTVDISFYATGTLIGRLQDINKNGELIQTTGSNGLNEVAGVVLYKEGFILLTGSWNLDENHTDIYDYNHTGSAVNPKWIFWGAGLDKETNYTFSSSFDLNFDGTNYINVLTMMAHADKGELNHSNNPTYISYGQEVSHSALTTANGYFEYPNTQIKNTVKYAYDNFTGSLEKQTYISKIGIYDENKNLIAVAKLAKPVRKPENRDLTFKLKLDI